MGKPSRDKGKRGEREVVNLAKAAGFERARRAWQTPQVNGDIDLDGKFGLPIYIEVRRRERLDVSAWASEVESAAPPNHLPIVAYRRSQDPWRAICRLDKLLELIHAAQDRDSV